MKLLVSITMLAVVLPACFGACSHWLSPNLKSLTQAMNQCAEYLRLTDETVDRYSKQGYPNEHSVRKLIHCTLVNLNALNADGGVRHYVLRNFFHPSPSDSCYENRTLECVDKSAAHRPQHQSFRRAYNEFACYYRHYGNVVDEEQFVPYNNARGSQEFMEAVSVEKVSRHALQDFSCGKALENDEFPEVLFTLSVRTGFYEPQRGVNFDRLYTQSGNEALLSEHTRHCEESVRRQYCEEPARLFQTFKQCLTKHLDTMKLVEAVSKKLLALPYASCSNCGSPAPCNTCHQKKPAPCSGCSKSYPLPCSSCSKSNELHRYHHGQPCYNGQCY